MVCVCVGGCECTLKIIAFAASLKLSTLKKTYYYYECNDTGGPSERV